MSGATRTSLRTSTASASYKESFKALSCLTLTLKIVRDHLADVAAGEFPTAAIVEIAVWAVSPTPSAHFLERIAAIPTRRCLGRNSAAVEAELG